MDLLEIAAKLFLQHLGKDGGQLDLSVVSQALGQLLGGDDGQLDLADLVSKFQGGDLAGLASSWLSDGENNDLSANQVESVLGSSALSAFAFQLGLEKSTASQTVASIIPELIDKGSSGGQLLDSLGGAGGVMSMASKLFG